MSIRTKRRKWRAAKIGGKTIRKIYKNGKLIFDYSKPLSSPQAQSYLIDIRSATYRVWRCPKSQWFRIHIAAAAGGAAASGQGGGQGGYIVHDVWIQQDWEITLWAAAGTATGCPPYLKGGNGRNGYNNGYSGGNGAYGTMGGGGAAGDRDSGGGGGGAGGNGGAGDGWNGGPGGGGAGCLCIEQFFAWSRTDESGNKLSFYTKRLKPLPGDKAFYATRDSSGVHITDAGYIIQSYNAATNSVIAKSTIIEGLPPRTFNYDTNLIFDFRWIFIILAGGGGGGSGDNGSRRAGGGGGGAGGTGGGTYPSYAGGGGTWSSLPGIRQAESGGNYSGGAHGSANAIVMGVVQQAVLGGWTSTTGAAVLQPLF